jgi:hypothetical protein
VRQRISVPVVGAHVHLQVALVSMHIRSGNVSDVFAISSSILCVFQIWEHRLKAKSTGSLDGIKPG